MSALCGGGSVITRAPAVPFEAMTTAVMTTRGLSKTYGSRQAVKNLDL